MKSIFSLSSEISGIFILTCVSVIFGTLLPIGFNLAVMNSPAEYIQEWFQQTLLAKYNIVLSLTELRIMWASAISIYVIGAASSSFVGARLANKFGRKIAILIASLCYISGAILFIFCRSANSIEMLFIGRFIIGIAAGLITSIVPMYLTEIAPSKWRGSVGAFPTVSFIGGIVLGQVISLPEILGSNHFWHYSLSFYVILVLLTIVFYPWFPESPKFLYVIAGKKEDAKQVLIRLYTKSPQIIAEEITSMDLEIKNSTRKFSVWAVLRDRSYMLPLILVCTLQAGIQFSGVNAVTYYSVIMFESTGMSSTNAKWANLATGIANLFVAIFNPIIMAKFNRRPVVIGSYFFTGIFLTILIIIISVSHLAIWLSYASIGAVILYLCAFQIGIAPTGLFIASELFESEPRSAAMAIGSITYWLGNFLVAITFPSIQLEIGPFAFAPYAIICFILTAFFTFYLPETRNKDTTTIAALVNNGFKSKPLQKLN